MARFIMLEKALFVSKLFLDGWEKLLSEDVLVPFFIDGCVLVSEPTPLAEKQPHTWSPTSDERQSLCSMIRS
jgi:hypothetical protein